MELMTTARSCSSYFIPATLIRLDRFAADKVFVISVISRIGESTFRSSTFRRRRKDIIRSRSARIIPAIMAAQMNRLSRRSSDSRIICPSVPLSSMNTGRHGAPPDVSTVKNSFTWPPKFSGAVRSTITASARASCRISWLYRPSSRSGASVATRRASEMAPGTLPAARASVITSAASRNVRASRPQ